MASHTTRGSSVGSVKSGVICRYSNMGSKRAVESRSEGGKSRGDNDPKQYEKHTVKGAAGRGRLTCWTVDEASKTEGEKN